MSFRAEGVQSVLRGTIARSGLVYPHRTLTAVSRLPRQSLRRAPALIKRDRVPLSRRRSSYARTGDRRTSRGIRPTAIVVERRPPEIACRYAMVPASISRHTRGRAIRVKRCCGTELAEQLPVVKEYGRSIGVIVGVQST